MRDLPRIRLSVDRQIRLPFRFNELGEVEYTINRAEQMADNIRTIILTRINERVMRPTYGSRAFDLLFEPNGSPLQATLIQDLQRAITEWEPGVVVQDIQALEESGPEEPGRLSLEVTFSLVEGDSSQLEVYSATVDLGGEISEVQR